MKDDKHIARAIRPESSASSRGRSKVTSRALAASELRYRS